MSGYYSTNGGWHVFRLVADEKPTGYSGPYVVIDPEDREAVERLADYLDSAYSLEYAQQRLREYANPKPPKPDEPQGLGAVVEDEDGSLLIRNAPTGSRPWVTMHGATFDWSEIDAVRVLSPGVEVDQ